jgi:tetratricopeptide (TPR) repeat protein
MASSLPTGGADPRAGRGASARLAAAWSNRPSLWYEQGELDRAIEDLTTALELDDDPDIRANLELATAAAGELSGAR